MRNRACVSDKVQGAVCISEGFMSDGFQQEVATAHKALHLVLFL